MQALHIIHGNNLTFFLEQSLANTDPVSYTHLDVYKRQAQYLRYQSRWANLTDKNGGLASSTETVHWLVIGRWK